MWHCASLCLILIIAVWMMSYGLMRHDFNENKIQVNIIRKDTVRINESVKEVGNNKNNKIKHHIPKFMLELYERSKGFKKNNSAPDVVRSVVPTHAETIYPDFLNEELNNDHHMLIFKVPKTNSDELFLEAQLRILTVVQIPSSSLLGIERVLKISFYNESTRTLTTIEEKHIYQNDNSWVSFNVSTVVRSLLNKSVVINSKLTLKLILTIKSFVPVVENKLGVFKLSLMPLEENYEHDYPVLLLYYKVDGRKVVEDRKMEYEVVRSKRNVEEDYEEETNRVWDENGVSKPINKKLKRIRNACRRRPLYVDFAEISYDTWIVQPDGYEAYQCLGKCFYPVAEHLSPTKHAIVQALLHSVSPSRAPRSCCVPTKLDSISILYIDEQGVLTYRYGYKDMVVTECGCR